MESRFLQIESSAYLSSMKTLEFNMVFVVQNRYKQDVAGSIPTSPEMCGDEAGTICDNLQIFLWGVLNVFYV